MIKPSELPVNAKRLARRKESHLESAADFDSEAARHAKAWRLLTMASKRRPRGEESTAPAPWSTCRPNRPASRTFGGRDSIAPKSIDISTSSVFLSSAANRRLAHKPSADNRKIAEARSPASLPRERVTSSTHGGRSGGLTAPKRRNITAPIFNIADAPENRAIIVPDTPANTLTRQRSRRKTALLSPAHAA